MPDLSGPRLNNIVKDLSLWAAQTRQTYIEALSQGGPYGSQKLTPQEQVMRFIQSTPQDYEGMIAKLNEKYRGLPDAQNKVNTDLAQYIRRMITLMLNRGQLTDQEFNQQQEQIQSDVAAGPSYQIGAV